MKKLLCLLGGAMLALHVQSQEIKPLSIGDTVPDILFDSVMNFPKSRFKLSDFKGKLVILDFFGTWCGACMPYIPKLDSFQKELKDKIQVVVICHDPSNELVSKFIKKKWKDKGVDIKLPFVLVDSLKSGLFPHRMVPHEIWISPEGKLMATTDGDEVSMSNLNTALENPNLKLKQKIDQMAFDRYKPLFVNGNGGSLEPLKSKSIFSTNIEGILSCVGTSLDSINHKKRVYFINVNPMMLIQMPFGYPINRVMFKSGDSLKFVKNIHHGWIKDKLFCYELTVADTTSEKLINQMMLDDILTNLNVSAHVEDKIMDCYILKRNSNGLVSQLPPRSKKKGRVNVLVSKLEYYGFFPTIDETNYNKEEINTEIPPDSSQNSKQLNKVLKSRGLQLISTKKKIRVLVIKRNSTN